jgi:hypothetical protein
MAILDMIVIPEVVEIWLNSHILLHIFAFIFLGDFPRQAARRDMAADLEQPGVDVTRGCSGYHHFCMVIDVVHFWCLSTPVFRGILKDTQGVYL